MRASYNIVHLSVVEMVETIMRLLGVEPKVDVGLAPKMPPPEPNALGVDEGCPNMLVLAAPV